MARSKSAASSSLGAAVPGFRRDHDLIEPRRHRIDKLHVVDELGMVLRRHLGADENRQMADFGIDGVEDPLAVLPVS